MPNQNMSGRGNGGRGAQEDETGGSWRPEDEREQLGQGQSGYGSGRYQQDRAFGAHNRNQSYGGQQGFQGNQDERFSGRGGEPLGGSMGDDGRSYNPERHGAQGGHGGGRGFEDRQGRDAGSSGYGGSGAQGFRSGSSFGAQQYNQGRSAEQLADRGGPDRGQWNAYSRDDDRSFGGDQSMYGQGQRGPTHMASGRGQHGGPIANQNAGGGMQPGRSSGGMHRGKGPQGYQRSDERIRECVCEALEHDEHIDATHIEVVVKNGEVMLTGTVDDRQTKRMAEDCAEHVAGVKDVQNNLRVQGDRPQARPSSSNNNGNGAHGKTETETEPSQTGGSDRKARA